MRTGMILLVVAAVAASGCSGGANDRSEATDTSASPAATADPTPVAGEEISDPVDAWVAGATTALADGDPSFLYRTMHPDARASFRWCDTAWHAASGVDWVSPAELTADVASAAASAWTGADGPLSGRSFDDASTLPVTVRVAGGDPVSTTVPYVIIDGELAWLADCPPKPERPEPEPAAAAPAARTSNGAGTGAAGPSSGTGTGGSSSGGSTSGGSGSTDSGQLVRSTGTFEVWASFGGRMYDSAPKSCDGWGEKSFQIHVLDGAGTIVALARITGGSYTVEEDDGSAFTMECDFEYTVEVPQLQVYTFVLVSKSGVEEQRRLLSADEFRSSGAPGMFWSEVYYA